MSDKKIPLRACTGCREMKEKRELIRVVRDSEGNVSIDFSGKKAGRGAYLCKNEACLTKAIRTKGLERSLNVPIGAELYEVLRKELLNHDEG